MEITLNIPQNTWSKPVEVRTEVVQLICDTFLKGETWYSLYNAIVKNPYRGNMEFGNNENYGYKCSKKSDQFVTFHECEMETAFKALRKAGYLFESDYYYGSSCRWYKLTKKNYSQLHNIVIGFTEQWD
jgi:hypothetical protein